MKKNILALIILSAITAPAFAANEGGYIAIDSGTVSYSNALGGPTNTAAFPNPGTVRIGGGYHLSQNLGIEVGYSIIGNSEIATLGAGGYTETVKSSSYQIAAVGIFPINDTFEVFGKLGMANTKMDYTITGSITSSASASKTNLMLGLGGQYNINRNFGIRVQYEDFGKVTVPSSLVRLTDVGVKIVSVGGVYNF
jgi:OOP family OmpA-OmpF porin